MEHRSRTSTEGSASLEYRALSGQRDVEAWLDLVKSCFRSCREYFEDHYKLDPKADESLIFVALDEGKMVGSVRVFQREVNVRGHGQQSMAGIGEVCTLASHQGKGIQRRLMTMAMEEAQNRRFSLAALHAASGVIGMYRKFGFFSIPFVLAYETWERSAFDDAKVAWPHQVQPLEDHHFRQGGVPDWVPALYEQTIAAHTGPIARSPEYWATWVTKQTKEVFSHLLAVSSVAADGSARAFLLIGAVKKGEVPEGLREEKHSRRLKVLDFLCEPRALARPALGALVEVAERVAGQRAAASAASPDARCSIEGTGGPGDPVLLCCIPAAMLPAPASSSGFTAFVRNCGGFCVSRVAAEPSISGVRRHEVVEDTVMYRRLCADDAVWQALEATDASHHACIAVDSY